jgi:NAD(P)H-hydrate epimerase
VLAGMIAGIIAQGKDILRSVQYAVYLHGLAGDLAAKDLTEECMTATDILEYLSVSIKEIAAE